MLSFYQQFRIAIFVFFPGYIAGRTREFESQYLVVKILSWILPALIGCYVIQLSNDYYQRGAYDEARKYAGTD